MKLSDIILHIPLLQQPTLTLNSSGLHFSYVTREIVQSVFESMTQITDLIHLSELELSLSVSHQHVFEFLKKMDNGSFIRNDRVLKDALDALYIESNQNRAMLLGNEIMQASDTLALPLTNTHFTLEQLSVGIWQNQLIAKVAVMQPNIIAEHISTPDKQAHVVFILDRSSSMRGKPFELLQQALINTIQNLSDSTRVTIYFYDNTLLVQMSNKLVSDISKSDIEAIRQVKPGYGTRVSSAIKSLVHEFLGPMLLTNTDAFDNLTTVWLTDGINDDAEDTASFIELFKKEYTAFFSEQFSEDTRYNGYYAMPQLIPVGVGGHYDPELLNGIATNASFKSNLMLHIDSPQSTSKLFEFVKTRIGQQRKNAIFSMSVQGKSAVSFDLGIMQAGERRAFFIEIPMPLKDSPGIDCQFILGDEHYKYQYIQMSPFTQDIELIVDYLNYVKSKIIIARHTNVALAEKMRSDIVKSLPSTVGDPRIKAIRREFIYSKELSNPLKPLSSNVSDNANSFLGNMGHSSASSYRYDQQMLSEAFQSQLSDQWTPF